MILEDIEKTICGIVVAVDGHRETLNKITQMFKKTAEVLAKQENEIAFLGEQLVDIAKKVNESLMIANDYERKQIRLEKQLQTFLKNM